MLSLVHEPCCDQEPGMRGDSRLIVAGLQVEIYVDEWTEIPIRVFGSGGNVITAGGEWLR